MSERRRWVIALLALGVAAIASLGAVALAQDDGSADPAAAPEGTSETNVPRGPYVDFCPTPEQTEAHLRLYGFDYKPTVACTREGEAPPPTPEQRADTAQDPDEGLTDTADCEHAKQLLESAKPLPNSDGDPTTVEGVLPDGRQVVVSIMTDKPATLVGETVKDQAEVYPC